MKTKAIGVLVCLLAVPALGTAKNRTFRGEIMDSQCAMNGSHEMMLKKEGMDGMKDDAKAKTMCTLNCVKKMGGKYVLFDATSKTAYQLDDQTKPEAFAGQKVIVTGSLDEASKTIHVTSIKPAS